MTIQDKRADQKNAGPDLTAGWVIGVYLVLEVAVLGYVGAMFWLSSSMQQLLSFPLHPPGLEFLRETFSAEKFPSFRQLALAACSAGAGGSVFMIREFYISFAYGFEKDGVTTYLKNTEIPRYIMLPFSSVVLGPISIFLLQTGVIFFMGFSPDKSISDYTVMAISFLFGFSYHDSLKALGRFSSKILGGKKEHEKKG